MENMILKLFMEVKKIYEIPESIENSRERSNRIVTKKG